MFRRVAGVVEWIVGVFVFGLSAWFVHAVADCDPGGVGAGPGGCCSEYPLGFLVRVPCHGEACVGVVEPLGDPRVNLRWQVSSGVGVVACYEVQYGLRCGGCVGVTGRTCWGHLLAAVGDHR